MHRKIAPLQAPIPSVPGASGSEDIPSAVEVARLRLEGQRLLGEGRFDLATEAFRKVFLAVPEDMSVGVMLGDLCKELNRRDEAYYYFERVAYQHEQNQDFGNALILLEKMADLRNDRSVRERRVKLHIRQRAQEQDQERAAAHERKAMDLLVELAEETKDQEEAVGYYRKMTEIEPLNAKASMKLAQLLIKSNRRKEAVSALVAAAKGLMKKRMLQEAGDIIMEAAKLDDNNPDIKVLFFRLQLAEGYVKVGLEGLHKIHQEFPTNLEVVITLARAYVSFNQVEVARDWFLKAYRLGNSPIPLEHVAERLMEKGNPDGALKALAPVAETMREQGDFPSAVRLLHHIHDRGDHRPTMELLINFHRLHDQLETAAAYLEGILNTYAAEGRGQEGLTYLWKMMEDENDPCWRKQIELMTTRFMAGGGKGATLRPFPTPEHPAPTGEHEMMPPKALGLDDLIASLPNRRLLKDRINQAMKIARRQNQLVALLIIDLDRQRWEAHLDQSSRRKALCHALEQIMSCIRDADTLAYLGGDEYAVLLQGINVPQNIQRAVGKIIAKIIEPIKIDDHTLKMVLNLGVAIYPNDGDQVSALMQKADTALVRAREKGRNTYALYTEKVSSVKTSRRGFEKELLASISRNQLVLHYQPIVDLRQRVAIVVGSEALVRWQHPDLGLLYPRDFIHLAGETGFISQLGQWVLSQSVKQVREWHERGHQTPWLTLNLTAEQCRDRSFLAGLKRTMETNGLPDGVLNLGIESSEALMLDNSEETRAQLHWIRRLGVILAIDDFGAGNTSVINLKRSPVSTVKIDASHVHLITYDDDIASLVRGLIGLAISFDLNVVAEGVETLEQARFLRDAGCQYAQGFFFSKPLPAHEMEEMLDGSALPLGESLPLF